MQSVLLLKHEPIPLVRIGLIGLGNRGRRTLLRYLQQEGVEIKAICDLKHTHLEEAQHILCAHGRPSAVVFDQPDGWMRLCRMDGLDMVFVCTDWLSHTKMAVYAMQQGRHVAIEVPVAMTVDDCWLLVNTAEKTRRHCVMLENCCYDPFVLNVLHLSRQGVLGEIVHAEGAYIHDLRKHYFASEDEGGNYDRWGKEFYRKHTGNPYPTHGLGPACQLLGIHRKDRMTRLVSMSSGQFGLSEYALERYGAESNEAQISYRLGDVNSTLIQTELGKSILIQHCISNPRPYSRLHVACGTKGYAQKYPVPCLALDGNGENPLTGDELKLYFESNRHPFLLEYEEKAKRIGVENVMNYIMDCRLIDCLHRGEPLDMDVYDAVEWSCLTELCEQSVLHGSQPVEIPDFTRGAYKKYV